MDGASCEWTEQARDGRSRLPREGCLRNKVHRRLALRGKYRLSQMRSHPQKGEETNGGRISRRSVSPLKDLACDLPLVFLLLSPSPEARSAIVQVLLHRPSVESLFFGHCSSPCAGSAVVLPTPSTPPKKLPPIVRVLEFSSIQCLYLMLFNVCFSAQFSA